MASSNITKKIRSSAIKVAVLSVFLIVMLIIVSNNAFGWFAMNKDVNGNGMAVSVHGDDGVEVGDYWVYKRDGALGAALVSSKSNPDTFELTEFDTIFIDKNVDTPIVIRAKLTDVHPGELTIKINISCPNSNFLDENNKFLPNLSNICSFSASLGTASLDSYDSETEAVEIYDESREELDKKSTYSFVEYNETTGEYEKNCSIVIPLEATVTEDFLYVYIELSYNSSLVEEYLAQCGEDYDVFGSDDTISFSGDIDPLVFTFE